MAKITAPLGERCPPMHGTTVIVVMGVSGAGKSTIAAELGAWLGWPLQEGDDLHPAENVRKMRSGVPLTDADRWPWLDRVSAWIDARRAAGEPGIVSCSALTRAHRRRLARPEVLFAYLQLPEERLRSRLDVRTGHFMPPALLDSQLAALEPPGRSEQAVTVDARLPPVVQADVILAAVRELVLLPRLKLVG